MTHFLQTWAIAAFAVCAACVFCGGRLRASPSPELRARVDTLLDQLEDPDASVRKAADAQLNSLPGDAVDLIETAAKREDLGIDQTTKLKRALTYLRPRAKNETEKKLRVDWERKAFVAAYNGGGHANAADAALSRAALAAYVNFLNFDSAAQPALRPELTAVFKKATDAGATDPLVLTLATLADGRGDIEKRWHSPDGSAVIYINQVLNGPYPLFVKYEVQIERLGIMSNWISEWPRAYDQFKQLADDPTLPPRELDRLALQYYNAVIDTHPDHKFVPAFLDMYSAAAPHQTYPLILQAIYQARTAAERVQGRNADAVGMAFFQDHLQQGQDLLAKAWQIDPADTRVAIRALRINCDQGEQGGGRASMETWFHRAVDSNPDNAEAYRWKLYYLYLHGNDGHKAYLAFARDCLNTQDYYAGIPGMLMDAHLKLADSSDDSAEYFAKPDVWTDVQSFYEACLANFPDNRKIHGEYAQLAARCGHWDVVRRQCEILGDKPTDPPFKSMESYNYLRRKAERLAGSPPPK